jgi:hypothetical protein
VSFTGAEYDPSYKVLSSAIQKENNVFIQLILFN